MSHPVREPDDDCILIEQDIETIDLTIDDNDQKPHSPAVSPPVIKTFCVSGAYQSPHPSSLLNSSSKTGSVASGSGVSFKGSFQAVNIEINCAICLESVKTGIPVSTTCGHLFCKICIERALRINQFCPICKKVLAKKNPFHPVYF